MIRIVRGNRIADATPYFQDGGHDVISRTKVLQSGECIHIVRPAPAASASCSNDYQLPASSSVTLHKNVFDIRDPRLPIDLKD